MDVAEFGGCEGCEAEDGEGEGVWVSGVEVGCEEAVGEEGAEEGVDEVDPGSGCGDDAERAGTSDVTIA